MREGWEKDEEVGEIGSEGGGGRVLTLGSGSRSTAGPSSAQRQPLRRDYIALSLGLAWLCFGWDKYRK
jgi:hypothetical protein